ncbi:MAG: type IV secretion system DNA-binding domain-containing protein [Candidatus Uhrbacteria bacterium]
MPAYTDHDHEHDVIYFARTNYRNQMRKFGIKTDDRRRHTYVVGKTGMGKTTLLENMILSDIYLGHGCAYVDPHGDTAEKLTNYIPEWRQKDVVYFCPSDVDFPMGFNILESHDPNTRHVIASGLMQVFKKIWPDVWSARMEHILNNCIMTLLENPGNTLMGVNRLLVDRDFRVRMVSNLQDPVVKAFWITEFEQWEPKFRTEAIAPIQNKVGQFLSTAIVRNIVAQVNSTILPREIMDSGKIFIVNLSKGRIGEDAMKLLGGMLITKIQLCAMERVDIPEIERRDFYLYIDEFQNFATESFTSILSEARKYRLALIMAHQYIEQLSEEVRAAVFGNVGTIILFRVGSPDAAFLETEFMPRFLPEDLVNLAKFEVYLRLMIDGVASEPFSALTLPPIVQKTDSAEFVIQNSRALYAHPRDQVAKDIMTWSEMEGGGVEVSESSAAVEKQFEKAEEQRKAVKKFGNKPLFEYDCTRCKKHMVLPVELDKSRPIYCEDCIEIVREERKKGGPAPSSPSSAPRDNSSGRPPEPRKIMPAPQVREGIIVTRETSETVSLSALKPKENKLEPPAAPVAPAATLPAVPPSIGLDFLAQEFKPVPPVQNVQPVQAAPLVQSVQNVQSGQVVQAAPAVRPVQPAQPVQGGQVVQNVNPVQPAQSNQNNESPNPNRRRRSRGGGGRGNDRPSGGPPVSPNPPTPPRAPQPMTPKSKDDVFPW